MDDEKGTVTYSMGLFVTPRSHTWEVGRTIASRKIPLFPSSTNTKCLQLSQGTPCGDYPEQLRRETQHCVLRQPDSNDIANLSIALSQNQDLNIPLHMLLRRIQSTLHRTSLLPTRSLTFEDQYQKYRSVSEGSSSHFQIIAGPRLINVKN
ncbi:hypothetical protein J6590_000315 [Homalodisca vitripennis]|nr:hypothetical protein J6590_000315 [Homalodisca vitripennis]